MRRLVESGTQAEVRPPHSGVQHSQVYLGRSWTVRRMNSQNHGEHWGGVSDFYPLTARCMSHVRRQSWNDRRWEPLSLDSAGIAAPSASVRRKELRGRAKPQQLCRDTGMLPRDAPFSVLQEHHYLDMLRGEEFFLVFVGGKRIALRSTYSRNAMSVRTSREVPAQQFLT